MKKIYWIQHDVRITGVKDGLTFTKTDGKSVSSDSISSNPNVLVISFNPRNQYGLSPLINKTKSWKSKKASAAAGARPFGATSDATLRLSRSGPAASSLLMDIWSSETTRSKTWDMSCWTVAAAVWLVVGSRVKCSRKQSTKHCESKNTFSWVLTFQT